MRAYNISILCGITPLVIGTSVFLLWVITRWNILEKVGFYTILAGMVFVVIGAVALIVHFIECNKTRGDRPALFREAARAAGILLVNFPVALLIIFLVSHISSFYTVVVKNDSPYQLDYFVIQSTGTEVYIGFIPSRKSVTRNFKVKEGSITFKTSVDQNVIEGTIEGYVSGSGDRKVVTIHRDKTYTVEKY